MFGYVCMSACSSVCLVLPKWGNKEILGRPGNRLDEDIGKNTGQSWME